MAQIKETNTIKKNAEINPKKVILISMKMLTAKKMEYAINAANKTEYCKAHL